MPDTKKALNAAALKLHRDINLGLVESDATTAMKLAVADPEFAKALVADPSKFSTRFKLSPAEIGALKGIGTQLKDIPKVGDAAAEYE